VPEWWTEQSAGEAARVSSVPGGAGWALCIYAGCFTRLTGNRRPRDVLPPMLGLIPIAPDVGRCIEFFLLCRLFYCHGQCSNEHAGSSLQRSHLALWNFSCEASRADTPSVADNPGRVSDRGNGYAQGRTRQSAGEPWGCLGLGEAGWVLLSRYVVLLVSLGIRETRRASSFYAVIYTSCVSRSECTAPESLALARFRVRRRCLSS